MRTPRYWRNAEVRRKLSDNQPSVKVQRELGARNYLTFSPHHASIYKVLTVMATEPTGLLSLPAELLQTIVDYILHPDIWDKNGINWEQFYDTRECKENQQRIRRQTICSMRLTNKALHSAASHNLLPILRIYLNEKSLARAEAISKVSQIASGVRGVELILSCCADNLANDLQTFLRFKRMQLDNLDHDGDWYREGLDGMLYPEPDSDLEASSGTASSVRIQSTISQEILPDKREQLENELRQFSMARKRWRILEDTWDGREDVDVEADPQRTEDRQLLLTGFQRFQALHKEQHQLITTGEFATRFISILSTLNRVESISLGDATEDIVEDHDGLESAYTLLSNDKILQLLSAPISWSCYTTTSGLIFTESVAAALFWDAPIAMHRAGRHLRGLRIKCFSNSEQFEQAAATCGFIGGTQEEFQTSVSKLESLYFHPAFQNVDAEHFVWLSPRQERLVADYLTLCASSSLIRHLDLNLETLSSFESNQPGVSKPIY